MTLDTRLRLSKQMPETDPNPHFSRYIVSLREVSRSHSAEVLPLYEDKAGQATRQRKVESAGKATAAAGIA